jgi:hypothetical protein
MSSFEPCLEPQRLLFEFRPKDLIVSSDLSVEEENNEDESREKNVHPKCVEKSLKGVV